MPTARSYYPTGASATDVSGVDADPTAALQALLARETQVMSAPRPPVMMAPPPSMQRTANAPMAPPRQSEMERRSEALDLEAKSNAVRAAKRDASYQAQLQAADLAGPKMRDYAGGAQVTGGFIADENSMPWSMRPKGGASGTLTGSNEYVPPTSDMFTAMNQRAADADGGRTLGTVMAARPRYNGR